MVEVVNFLSKDIFQCVLSMAEYAGEQNSYCLQSDVDVLSKLTGTTMSLALRSLNNPWRGQKSFVRLIIEYWGNCSLSSQIE